MYLVETFLLSTHNIFAQKNSLTEVFLLSTHNNSSFGWEVRKLFFCYALLTRVLIIELFFNQNISGGYSKELSQWDGSFEHPKHMLKIMGRKYLQFYAEIFCLSKPVYNVCISALACMSSSINIFNKICDFSVKIKRGFM